MKKILLLLLVATLVFALSACGKDKDKVVKDDTNKTTEQKETDEVVDDKTSASDESEESSQTGNSNEAENNSSNEQSSTGQTTDTNNTTINDSSNKNNNQSNSNNTTTKPNTNTQTNTHKHSYSAATCTQPKKCSCGATEGSALGHKWVDATCTVQKACSVCKATSGSALGHNYDIDGVCTQCKAKDPKFTYPTLASMGGRWTCKYASGIMVVVMDYKFTMTVDGVIHIYDVYSNEEGTCCTKDRECIVWNNKHILCDGGDDLGFAAGRFEENNGIVYIYDDEGEQLILQRLTTHTMKVLAYDEEFGYSASYSPYKIPIGTIFTFESTDN